MPSPFPGMDPYLERPDDWRGVHHHLISSVAQDLQQQLNARGYYVDIESRVWMEEYERAIFPDAAVLRRTGGFDPAGPAGTLLADPPLRVERLRDEMHEDYLEIHEIGSQSLVTGIEVVSPSNKADHKARRLYLKKRKELAARRVNLVEIDLLRGGRDLVQVPKSALDGAPPDSYWISISRSGTRAYEFYALTVRDRLPRVAIPLKPGEADAVLDLAAAVRRAYEAGAYAIRIDYDRDPIPPLSASNADWARGLIEARGGPG